jgi:hypothetical protein
MGTPSRIKRPLRADRGEDHGATALAETVLPLSDAGVEALPARGEALPLHLGSGKAIDIVSMIRYVESTLVSRAERPQWKPRTSPFV